VGEGGWGGCVWAVGGDQVGTWACAPRRRGQVVTNVGSGGGSGGGQVVTACVETPPQLPVSSFHGSERAQGKRCTCERG